MSSFEYITPHGRAYWLTQSDTPAPVQGEMTPSQPVDEPFEPTIAATSATPTAPAASDPSNPPALPTSQRSARRRARALHKTREGSSRTIADENASPSACSRTTPVQGVSKAKSASARERRHYRRVMGTLTPPQVEVPALRAMSLSEIDQADSSDSLPRH
ncbi:hypothetical protein BD413DRAFT_200251 [Trametes elegans]|nr:hypothetical protein BD413DRAFT_200251 [Trametes elegans]